jgi:TetR/AcrR family transcriptional regulator, acrAB operon repressor
MAQLAHTDLGTRDKILDGAEDLFARRGFSGVGMREVAEAAGLSKSSLFHHFKTKIELYAAVVGRILELIENALLRGLAHGGSPLERLDRWLDTLIDILVEHPNSARLLLRSLFEDDDLSGTSPEEQAIERLTQRIFSVASNLLREGMENGLFRMASIPHTLQSLVGLTVYHFASGEFGEELVGQSLFAPAQVKKRKEEIKALLHHGLVARGSEKR